MSRSNIHRKQPLNQPLNIKYHLYEHTPINSIYNNIYNRIHKEELIELEDTLDIYKCNTEEELEIVSKEKEVYMDKSYISKILLGIALILLALGVLFGCSTSYIDTDTSTSQAKAVSAVLSECVAQPMGIVGDTNLSLVRAYINSTESLIVCQEISQGVIDGLNK